MLIKILKVECTLCHNYVEVSEVDEDFEKWVEMDSDGPCPNCLNKLVDKL